ncbi:MAG: preprotein translocase subunit YajC [Lentisphaeria bacterium]|nr:preprotein translocase subunit YajC [Lentisphaeria bacterium]
MTENIFAIVAQSTAAPAAQGSASSGGSLMGLAPMLIVMGVMIYFMWRGQKKEQKRRQEMIEGVKVGDSVITVGGIYGEVVAVKDDRFIVKIADNVKIEMAKTAVASVPSAEAAAKQESSTK